jgi:hypothetical protein
MALTFEDMIRAETETHVCRMWRKQDAFVLSNKDLLKDIARDTMNISSADIQTMVKVMIVFDELSAVEIIDRKTGDGVCVYKDWP